MTPAGSLVVQAVGWALLHFLWQGALLWIGTAAILALMRHSDSRIRYAIACAALSVCAIIPAVTVYRSLSANISAMPAYRLPAWAAKIDRMLPDLVLLWSLGVLLMAGRLAMGMVWVRKLRRSGRIDEIWQLCARRIGQRLDWRGKIAVRIADGVSSPVTVGWLRPVIILPAALLMRMPADLVEALLAHEVAHVARLDYLVNLLQNAVESVLFFHPAVWWLSGRIRVEREQVADGLAATALGESRRLMLALKALSDQPHNAPQPVLNARGGELLGRLKRLARPSDKPMGWRASAPVLGLVLSGLMLHAHAQAAKHVHQSPAPDIEAAMAASSSRRAEEFASFLTANHVIVRDQESGQILLAKDADAVVPIASLTKLMTAMVVLDAQPDMDQSIRIDAADVDKFSESHLPIGTSLRRGDIVTLALLSSDNRAAHALARTYPGGVNAFARAMRTKIAALGLAHTSIDEPTGLSPRDVSTATDMVAITDAAATYPEIARITSDEAQTIEIKGRPIAYRNHNPLVGRPDWHIDLSKTGFTSKAGGCLVMRFEAAGKRLTMVLLDAGNQIAAREIDADSIKSFLADRAPKAG
jgi:D-alanyl-D-alanine endopeptidase (penicillin-binding protein 7)